MISTRDLSVLPDVDALRRTLQSMALLDAIICPEWHIRYYSFNAKWSPDEQMGSMRDGSGDGFFALFNAAGCWLKGFAHEAPMSPHRNDGTNRLWPGIVDSVPVEFRDCLREPAFNVVSNRKRHRVTSRSAVTSFDGPRRASPPRRTPGATLWPFPGSPIGIGTTVLMIRDAQFLYSRCDHQVES